MSGEGHHVFFALSTGLRSPITVPAGTLARCQAHVAEVECALGYETTKYLDNPAHWKTTVPKDGVTDEVLCETAQRHNTWVRWLYERLGAWSKEPPVANAESRGEPEQLTPEDAQTFWHGLEQIDVPVERWTPDYYRDRMEHMYEVLRGRGREGTTLGGVKPLSVEQAAAVIWLLDFLDPDDLRLAVPKGYDHLASYDDGYVWCEMCGAVDPDDADRCRKPRCPVVNERIANLSDMPAEEIAEEVGLSASTVRRRLRVMDREHEARLAARASEVADG